MTELIGARASHVEVDVFDRTDATIRDEPYVTVRRIAARHGSACRYEKIFKRDIKHGYGDFTPWAERENYFLQWLGLHNVEHVVQAAQINFLPTRDIASVVTYDAGITVADWLRVQPYYPGGTILEHPFQAATAFLQLMRGCLAALWEVHKHRIVHCDIREDNICVQHVPHRVGQQALRLDCNGVTLIDFAYSISRERALEQPLPIDPGTPYLSDQFRNALYEDQRAGSGRAVQQLDYRVDLFALGCMGERIIEEGALASLRPNGGYVVRTANDLLRQLKDLGGASKKSASGRLPHAHLLEEIDSCLAKTGDSQDRLAFEVFRQRTHDELTAARPGIRDTPVTRMATPISESARAAVLPPAAEPRTGKTAKLIGAAAVIAGLGVALFQEARVSDLRAPVNPQDEKTLAASAPGETDSLAVAAGSSRPDSFEQVRKRLAVQLHADDDQAFVAALKELLRFVSQDVPGAADLINSVIADQREALSSEAIVSDRLRALKRLRMAKLAGDQAAAQVIAAFESSYDAIKKDVVASTWWLSGEGTPPRHAKTWIDNGFVLAAAGDRPAKLDQAFALAHGRALKQDRAKSVQLYLQVIDSSKGDDPFSGKLRQAAVSGLVTTLNSVVRQKDERAIRQLQPLMARRATAGASDMQYYLGLFSECVMRPPNLAAARNWYVTAAADARWKSTAEQKLRLLGKWCPSDGT